MTAASQRAVHSTDEFDIADDVEAERLSQHALQRFPPPRSANKADEQQAGGAAVPLTEDGISAALPPMAKILIGSFELRAPSLCLRSRA